YVILSGQEISESDPKLTAALASSSPGHTLANCGALAKPRSSAGLGQAPLPGSMEVLQGRVRQRQPSSASPPMGRPSRPAISHPSRRVSGSPGTESGYVATPSA